MWRSPHHSRNSEFAKLTGNYERKSGLYTKERVKFGLKWEYHFSNESNETNRQQTRWKHPYTQFRDKKKRRDTFEIVTRRYESSAVTITAVPLEPPSTVVAGLHPIPSPHPWIAQLHAQVNATNALVLVAKERNREGEREINPSTSKSVEFSHVVAPAIMTPQTAPRSSSFLPLQFLQFSDSPTNMRAKNSPVRKVASKWREGTDRELAATVLRVCYCVCVR